MPNTVGPCYGLAIIITLFSFMGFILLLHLAFDPDFFENFYNNAEVPIPSSIGSDTPNSIHSSIDSETPNSIPVPEIFSPGMVDINTVLQ